MPLGKPGQDGDVVPASRHYGGQSGTLGVARLWECPACGRKVEGRTPEQGCPHCGAGDPAQVPARPASIDEEERSHPVAPTPPRPQPKGERVADVAAGAPPRLQATRVLRLIEYLIAPGQDATEVLRRSLVGTIPMAWGTITGTIVDSVDLNQEDRLRLAKLQPGVWIANERAMELGGFDSRRASRAPENPTGSRESGVAPRPGTLLLTVAEQAAIAAHFERKAMPTPDVGMPFTILQGQHAQMLLEIGGFKLCYTLALALQGIAEELAGNSEPEKFLTSQEALQLATALLAQVPDDWTGDAPDPTVGDA